MPPGFLLWTWTDTAVVKDLGGTVDQELMLSAVHDGEITVYADRDGKSAEATLVIGAGGRALAGRLVRWTQCDTSVVQRWSYDRRQTNQVTFRAKRAGRCTITATAGGLRKAIRVAIRP